MQCVNNQRGFTLIEVMIALLVLVVGILSVNMMQLSSIKGNAKASDITLGSNWAQFEVDRLMSISYDNADLLDDALGVANGTNMDLDFDGIDDNLNDFGLNDLFANADGSTVSPDGRYQIHWNVALDYPVVGVKFLRVHVAWSGLSGPASGIALSQIAYNRIIPEIL